VAFGTIKIIDWTLPHANVSVAGSLPVSGSIHLCVWPTPNRNGEFRIDRNGLKLAGFILLLTGWVLVICALVLLPAEASRSVFVCAGLLIELFGLGLAVRGHMPVGVERE